MSDISAHPRSVASSVALASVTISQNLQNFRQETAQWLNELPEFLKPLEAIPVSLDRIAIIVKARTNNPSTEQALCEEIGRLQSRVAQLEVQLAKAVSSPEIRSKPWFGTLPQLCAGFADLATAIWTVSGDDLGPKKRLENLSEYWELLSGALEGRRGVGAEDNGMPDWQDARDV